MATLKTDETLALKARVEELKAECEARGQRGADIAQELAEKCVEAEAERDALKAENIRLCEAQKRVLSGPEPTDDMDVLRNWRDSVVARAAAAGMPKDVGLCEWFEALAKND